MTTKDTTPWRLEFEISGLPKTTNSNHGHWRLKHAEAKKWKGLVFIMAHKHRKNLEKAKLTLTRFSSSRPDFDGLVSSWKHVVDGLIECGVLVNDKHENIGQPEYFWEKCPPKRGKIRVCVEAV